jgi:hypothetical protein
MVYAAGHDVVGSTADGLEHIGFGTVQGEDGKRFKTRSGDTVRLVNTDDRQPYGRTGEGTYWRTRPSTLDECTFGYRSS